MTNKGKFNLHLPYLVISSFLLFYIKALYLILTVWLMMRVLGNYKIR